jgi:hypothetical protein
MPANSGIISRLLNNLRGWTSHVPDSPESIGNPLGNGPGKGPLFKWRQMVFGRAPNLKILLIKNQYQFVRIHYVSLCRSET